MSHFWGQETWMNHFFFTWMGMCQIPDFILEKVKGGVWIFFCWPLSHDFLIKSLKAFGDEATPKTSQILVNLSLTFHKQITKDTQIPICTCTYYLSIQKWDFEVHKKNRNDSKAENFQRREDWFRALEQERKCVKVWC